MKLFVFVVIFGQIRSLNSQLVGCAPVPSRRLVMIGILRRKKILSAIFRTTHSARGLNFSDTIFIRRRIWNGAIDVDISDRLIQIRKRGDTKRKQN